MNILIFGYGKMGKTIEKIATDRGHTIALIIDKGDEEAKKKIDVTPIDVAIEFTQPDAAVDNLKLCFEKGIPVLSGTTGWLDQIEAIKSSCLVNNGTFFYASNYSLGVNIFFKLNQYLAKVMAGYSEYGITMEEVHHTEKKDAPSGTAISLADDVIKINTNLNRWALRDAGIEEGELPIAAKRIPDVPGTHVVNYESDVDKIEIKHVAHSRKGFAMGAVVVAEWIKDKKGYLTMDDFLAL